MTKENPFSGLPNRAIDDLMRGQREHAQFIARALGPTHNIQRQMEALRGPIQQFATLQKAGNFSALAAVTRLSQHPFGDLQKLMTPHWASAIQESALAVCRQAAAINSSVPLLSKSFDGGILATIKALQSHNSVLAAAMATGKWQDQFKAIADQLAPSLMAFRGTAERMAMIDMQTLRASAEHFHTSAIQAAAQQAVEAQHLIEAFAQVDSPEEGARLFTAFLALVAGILGNFQGNTIEELRKVGLFGIIAIFSAFISFFPNNPPKGQTEEQQQEFVEMRTQINEVQSQLSKLQGAEDALNESYVSDLPKAQLARKSNIRRSPAKDSPRILVAESGTLVAIAHSQGRWKMVVFRDPLTDQLSQGWVYGTSVTFIE